MKHKFLSSVIVSRTTSLIIVIMILTPGLTIASTNLSVESTSSAFPEWNLVVTGYVENPLNLSWTDIAAFPQTTVNTELICVDWPDQVLLSGNWTGIQLKLLLETAGISPQAMKVGFFATDNFSTDLTLETVMREDIIIAYELNGIPLGEEVRLVVPGKWGYKWIHHIENIILYNDNFLGYYESNGFSDEADVNTPSPPSRMIPEFQPWMMLSLFLIGTTILTIYKKYKFSKV